MYRRIACLVFALLALTQPRLLPRPAAAPAGEQCLGEVCISACPAAPVYCLPDGPCAMQLPNTYRNQSGSAVTITGVLRPSLFARSSVAVFAQDIPANTTVSLTVSPVAALSAPRPVASGQVDVVFLASGGASGRVGTCSYDVRVDAAGAYADLIEIPVRFCAVEGSWASEGHLAGELASGYWLGQWLQKANDWAWTPAAHIAFRALSAPYALLGYPGEGSGIPVIKNDYPQPGYPPDVPTTDLAIYTLADACNRVWAQLAPEAQGIPIVSVNRFTDETVAGVVPPLPQSLWVASLMGGSGQRGDDLCGQPRHLYPADITPSLRVAIGGEYNPEYPSAGTLVARLAHELGHAVGLHHGNGLDDNGDGLQPPALGPRRFDSYCDPQWVWIDPANEWKGVKFIEDEATPFVSCAESYSIMHPEELACFNNLAAGPLRPLQVEQARAVAELAPGAAFAGTHGSTGSILAPKACLPPACPLPAGVPIRYAEMSYSPRLDAIGFAVAVSGAIPAEAHHHYLIFADLDNDPQTGCAAGYLGFSTKFTGAELAMRVKVEPAGSQPAVTPYAWQCQGTTWRPVAEAGLRAFINVQPGASLVSLELPDALSGPAKQVRLQVVSQQTDAPGNLDRLPGEPAAGAILTLYPPMQPLRHLYMPFIRR